MRRERPPRGRNGWLGFGSTAEHGCERVRRFAVEHASRIMPSLIRTEARDGPTIVPRLAGAADAERRGPTRAPPEQHHRDAG
jgi:hypothetical protein